MIFMVDVMSVFVFQRLDGGGFNMFQSVELFVLYCDGSSNDAGQVALGGCFLFGMIGVFVLLPAPPIDVASTWICHWFSDRFHNHKAFFESVSNIKQMSVECRPEKDGVSPPTSICHILSQVYCDLDGVLADFNKGCLELFPEGGPIAQKIPTHLVTKLTWEEETEMWRRVEEKSDFFLSLDWTSDGAPDMFWVWHDMAWWVYGIK